MSEWRLIETVSRETHWVLLFDPMVSGGCVVGRYSGGHWWSHDDWVLHPTHWMALPARPVDVSMMPRHEFGER